MIGKRSKKEARITRSMLREFTYPRRLGSQRSDGVPPGRENLSGRADEVAGHSLGKRTAPEFC